MLLTCFEVAKYFIRLAHETGSFISNLKLQKLVYYAQAWHLALFEQPLFNEDFEAWIHGPVVPELYHYYKKFGWRNISITAGKKSLESKGRKGLQRESKSGVTERWITSCRCQP
ncbi:MAG: Panacea domain-containing protein [Sphaerospermopsis kisseleviana]